MSEATDKTTEAGREGAAPLLFLVEDEAAIRELLQFNLESEGYEVRAYANATALLADARGLPESKFVSLFLLDVMLPDMDGFEALRRLRAIPRYSLSSFLMLTALSSEKDKVDGLDSGADDYLTKPFGMKELLARVRRLLDRTTERRILAGLQEGRITPKTGLAGQSEAETCMTHGKLRLFPVQRRVYLEDKEVELTRLEFDFLLFLLRHPKQVLSRDQLLEHVWGFDFDGGSRTVDAHVRNLRRKLENAGLETQVIDTLRGVGYRLHEEK